MAFLGFGRHRHRGHEPSDQDRYRGRERDDERGVRDWGERRYAADERFGYPPGSERDGNYGQGYRGANPFERPEEFGQNRGDWHNDWRAEQLDHGLDVRRGSDRDRGERERSHRDYGWQPSASRSSEYRGTFHGAAGDEYGELYRGRQEGTHGAYWSPERTSFGEFGGDARGGELSSYGTGRFRGRGPKGYRRSDERIREDVCECLTDDDDIDATNIEVQVRECEVTLTGTVGSREEKRRAEDLIDRLSGVRDVHNQLRVVSEGGQVEGNASMTTRSQKQGSRH